MIRALGCFLAGCLLLTEGLSYSAELHTNFPNASLGEHRWLDDTTVVLSHSDDTEHQWFHFRLDGVENQTIRFVFPSIPTNTASIHSLPAYSYDQRHWAWIADRTITPASGTQQSRYEFEHTFSQNRVWIAQVPPYSKMNLDDVVRQATEHPHAEVITLCESAQDQRSVPVVRILDRESVVEPQTLVLLGRQQAHHSAASWVVQGAINFALSESPVAAALRRRFDMHIVPMLDVDGVHRGSVNHTAPASDTQIDWTMTWDEATHSFHEQRAMKTYLQSIHSGENPLSVALTLGSQRWNPPHIRFMESESIPEATQALLAESLQQPHLPWIPQWSASAVPGTFASVISTLFPNALSASIQSSWTYGDELHPSFPLLKTTDDLLLEGEALMRAIAQWSGIEASDPPPMLLSAMINTASLTDAAPASIQCVYRDIQNRPPDYVRCVINDTAIELRKANQNDTDYAAGALYVGTTQALDESAVHVFEASNGSQTTRSPRTGSWPGPYRISP